MKQVLYIFKVYGNPRKRGDFQKYLLPDKLYT